MAVTNRDSHPDDALGREMMAHLSGLQTDLALLLQRMEWVVEQTENHRKTMFGNGGEGLMEVVRSHSKALNKLENNLQMLTTPGSKVDEAKWYTYGKWGVALVAVSSFGMQVIQLIRDAGG